MDKSCRRGSAAGAGGIDDELRRYREEVRALMEENRELRRAASAFGRLAERLNLQLQQERRNARDRQNVPLGVRSRSSTRNS